VISAVINRSQLFYTSVYFPPEANIEAELTALQRIVDETIGHKVYIGGDFNVRSTLA
jgi:hypothetical protein